MRSDADFGTGRIVAARLSQLAPILIAMLVGWTITTIALAVRAWTLALVAAALTGIATVYGGWRTYHCGPVPGLFDEWRGALGRSLIGLGCGLVACVPAAILAAVFPGEKLLPLTGSLAIIALTGTAIGLVAVLVTLPVFVRLAGQAMGSRVVEALGTVAMFTPVGILLAAGSTQTPLLRNIGIVVVGCWPASLIVALGVAGNVRPTITGTPFAAATDSEYRRPRLVGPDTQLNSPPSTTTADPESVGGGGSDQPG